MGISTVSGPFRSKNGFQELVDGVWTPVGSGGVSSSLIYTEGQLEPVVLDLTEPGKTINIVGGADHYNNFIIPFLFVRPNGIPALYSGNIYELLTGFYAQGFGLISDDFPILYLTAPFNLTITSMGIYNDGYSSVLSANATGYLYAKNFTID